MKFACAHCGKTAEKPTGEVNRARKAGLRIFCNRRCSAQARRKHKTKAQRVAEKAAYDKGYRAKNLASITAKKADYFRRTYDPAKARIERKKRAAAHAEYCRRPEYKRWKQGYDRRYRGNKLFGPFAEAWMVVVDLNREIKSRSSNYEIRRQNQTWGKRQARASEEADRAIRDRARPAQGVGPA